MRVSTPSGTSPDYLLVADSENARCLVAVLELKTEQLQHMDQIVRQLGAGACEAEKLVPQGEALRFRPIAAVGRVHKHCYSKLKDKSNMSKFHGQKEAIRVMKCG